MLPISKLKGRAIGAALDLLFGLLYIVSGGKTVAFQPFEKHPAIAQMIKTKMAILDQMNQFSAAFGPCRAVMIASSLRVFLLMSLMVFSRLGFLQHIVLGKVVSLKLSLPGWFQLDQIITFWLRRHLFFMYTWAHDDFRRQNAASGNGRQATRTGLA